LNDHLTLLISQELSYQHQQFS